MISFFLPDNQLDVVNAAGIKSLTEKLPTCPFNVGDTITFPASRSVAFRVVSRQYQSQAQEGEADWLIVLELSHTPF